MNKTYSNRVLKKAYVFASKHRKTLEKDKICGCFNCETIFSPKEIKKWIEDDGDDTAICPYCLVDMVIGESSGFPITKEFLHEMKNYW